MFVVGIDGGGTKTRVAVCASDGTLLHRETLGAFNLSAIGEDGFRRRVGEILTLCGDMRACGALCVGGAGASGAAMGEILRAELAAHGFAGKLLLCGDHEIALAGAMQTPGCVLIAGTGSICYGKNAAGDTALLKKLCEQKGIELCVAPPENYEGAPISSTRIRAAVEEGKMHDAAKMLSRYFSFDFPVLQGDKIGRTLDMPTINQAFPKGFILPKVGVYAVNVNIEGKNYKGVCNIGPRPTIDRTEFRAETNIIGFSGDLYGKRPRISLVEYIRETKKFPSLLALREEVARNIDYTEKLQFEGDLIG